MKEHSGNKKTSSQFLKTDGGKTKSNAIEVPSISLPKGGGAIKGIDEKFSVNAVNATASFSIPLPVSQARGASPALSISYNSGSGNSIFGLGWSLSLSSIKRKTDKQLPQYLDTIDSDVFLFSEAEDLVPEFQREPNGHFSVDANGDYIIHEKESADTQYLIRYYRPRIEGLFARIERLTEKSSGIIKWRIITKENVTTLFGWSPQSRLCHPQDALKIYEWLPEFVFDDKGNCSYYLYKPEDNTGFDNELLHNRNRSKDGSITYANLYPEKVFYGNKTPYRNFGTGFPDFNDYLFETVFDYGEYDTGPPYEKNKDWDFRPDAFSEYKAGFEIRTTRLCKRVLLFHHFTGTDEYDGLVRSLDFRYDTSTEPDFTFLKGIISYGYIKHEQAYSSKSLPPFEFEYQRHEWNSEIKSVSTEAFVHAPVSIEGSSYQFVDLFNEGLSGILTEQAAGWYYKHNLGEGNFESAKLVSPKPSFTGLGTQLQLIDLDADGGKQLVNYNTEPRGFFELDDDNQWLDFQNFNSLPNIDFGDPYARMLDLNGDGRQEIMFSEDSVFTWYASDGRKGFGNAAQTLKQFDEEAGPHIVFADEKQTIFLADMSGDGLTDIVRIRNRDVCYWPNLGYGKFGAKVAMDNAPVFDAPDSFNPLYIKLADIDGSGTTDIIYLGTNKFTCWKNLSGNRFVTTPFEIEAFPGIHRDANITVADLLGNGVACIVWSSPLLKDNTASLKYIDLMNGKKPHVMIFYKNNMGKEVFLQYTPSTRFYAEDKLAGKPWITKLHFPVHCVSKSITEDRVTGHRFESSYKYHHGYYDHPEREFRGFGMVEQTDAEHFEHWMKGSATNIVEAGLHQQPVVTKQWFHTGAFLRGDKILTQFAHEYWYEEVARQGFTISNHEHVLPDARIEKAQGVPQAAIDNLNTDEWQQALRSCKGMPLRSETFAYDAPVIDATPDQLKRQLTPYTVATHNCVIELLQPKGKNKHAVFVVKESEAITYNYERDTNDPRIAHNLNIKLDEYSNVLESAAIVYPRLTTDETLPVETQQEQAKTIIIYTENKFTNDVIGDDINRLRLPSEVKTYELKGVTKTTAYYFISDFFDILDGSRSTEVRYHEIDATPPENKSQKRLIEHIRTIYYQDNLTGPLLKDHLESLAIPFESYQLAYTPELISHIYSDKVNAAILNEGRFTHSEDDENWWIRSGTTQFITGTEVVDTAQERFYVPVSYTDPYGAVTKVVYDEHYFLFIKETEDAFGNKTSVNKFNFRTLSPQRMIDLNGNLSETISDELGLPKAMAVFGKGNEADDLIGLTEFTDDSESEKISDFFTADNSVGLTALGKDLLQHATARFVYDFESKPSVVASVMREEHFQKSADSPVQLSFEYSNGVGKVVMKKAQAEPGIAKKVVVNADDTYTLIKEDTSASDPIQLRWIGNGRTVLNNKGNAVKQYEPYFSVTHRYEDLKELVETGVTPLMYYDALGRLIKTEMPDGTFSKVEFDSWKQEVFDANDTVLESLWYHNRTNRLIDAELIAEGKDPAREKAAAGKAAKHANTPNVLHFDTLGRAVLSVDHNKNTATEADEFYYTNVSLDTESNLRNVIDARGNAVMQYEYDMLGNMIYQKSMDAGQRWLLLDVVGKPLRTWVERDHVFEYYYDVLHRPTHSKVTSGDGVNTLGNIFDKIIYGENLLLADRTNEADLKAANILGKPVQHYDTGGLLATPAYDFNGQPLSTSRRLFRNYQSVANWIDDNLEDDLESVSDAFTFITQADALGKITRQTAPDGSIITPAYNEAGLLNGETVLHAGDTVSTQYIKDIDYNEKGQRNKIIYGNDVSTKFYYDKETFLLKRLETKRLNNDPLQDWYYTYDPIGNITHIEDKNIPVVFFDNEKITGISEYTYDALYRLVEATGRENNAALSFSQQDNWNDVSFMSEPNPGDPMALRVYTQAYQYDAVGNILQMRHRADGNNWTRNYTYETENNRLASTVVGSGGDSFTYLYPHHPQHGFIMTLPHLTEMGWNFKEELVTTSRQSRTDGTPETTYYQYDGDGQRIRKITENTAEAGVTPTKKEERIYISRFETYRTYNANSVNFERESLSLLDEGHRFVMTETVTINTKSHPAPTELTGKRLVRYQLHNHLGSACLELDSIAQVISYEEYHPYGTTAYQANNKVIKAAAKRYRFTGMERDEETGLEYHSARYYIPLLGRWGSADQMGVKAGPNLYSYSDGKPLNLVDINGCSPVSAAQVNQEGIPSFIDFMGSHDVDDSEIRRLIDSFRPTSLSPGSRSLRYFNDRVSPPNLERWMQNRIYGHFDRLSSVSVYEQRAQRQLQTIGQLRGASDIPIVAALVIGARESGSVIFGQQPSYRTVSRFESILGRAYSVSRLRSFQGLADSFAASGFDNLAGSQDRALARGFIPHTFDAGYWNGLVNPETGGVIRSVRASQGEELYVAVGGVSLAQDTFRERAEHYGFGSQLDELSDLERNFFLAVSVGAPGGQEWSNYQSGRWGLNTLLTYLRDNNLGLKDVLGILDFGDASRNFRGQGLHTRIRTAAAITYYEQAYMQQVHE